MSGERRTSLAAVSAKAAAAYDEVVSEATALLSEDAHDRWVALGCAIARESGAAATRFFRDSPRALALIARHPAFHAALDIAIQLARENYGLAIEFFRILPPMLGRLDPGDLQAWAGVGVEIARADYGAAVEYLRAGPAILDRVDLSRLGAWAELGVLLTRHDREQKDFIALEFFRTSHELLGTIPEPPLRVRLLDVALAVGRQLPATAMTLLRDAPVRLAALPDEAARTAVLRPAADLARHRPEAVADLLVHAPATLAAADGSVARWTAWAEDGVRLAARSSPAESEAVRAYFALQNRAAIAALAETSRAVYLREISRTLAAYAEGLCGRRVEIRPESEFRPSRSRAVPVIYLPDRIALFGTREENRRLYRVRVWHEAGHFEFESHRPVSEDVLLSEAKDQDSSASGLKMTAERKLTDFFPDRMLAAMLWTIIEEARVDFLLREEYPGIRPELDWVVERQMAGRPNPFEMPDREAALEALLQLSIADTASVPLPVAQLVSEGYDLLRRVRRPGATVDDSARAVARLYARFKAHQLTREEPLSDAAPAAPTGHAALPVELAFRGRINAPVVGPSEQGTPAPARGDQPVVVESPVSAPPAPQEAVAAPTGSPLESPPARSPSGTEFVYDEWDAAVADYRPGWCRVREERGMGDVGGAASAFNVPDTATVRRVRRSFERLRPEAFRRLRNQEDGDEIDLQRVVENAAERRAGLSPAGRIYIRREKRRRDVAAAFLIDLSGSTARQLPTGRRVIDVAREGLVMVAQALDALGDTFGLFGFSGRSREEVLFRVIQDFGEPCGRSVFSRIARLEPGGQNRDGAAIRHATRRLLGQPAHARLMIVISDGRPLDEGYGGTYAIEDTRVALREARIQGIRLLGVTIDAAASEYAARLYGEHRYVVISDAATLPDRLLSIYRRWAS